MPLSLEPADVTDRFVDSYLVANDRASLASGLFMASGFGLAALAVAYLRIVVGASWWDSGLNGVLLGVALLFWLIVLGAATAMGSDPWAVHLFDECFAHGSDARLEALARLRERAAREPEGPKLGALMRELGENMPEPTAASLAGAAVEARVDAALSALAGRSRGAPASGPIPIQAGVFGPASSASPDRVAVSGGAVQARPQPFRYIPLEPATTRKEAEPASQPSPGLRDGAASDDD